MEEPPPMFGGFFDVIFGARVFYIRVTIEF
jgi:hypothetical protein